VEELSGGLVLATRWPIVVTLVVAALTGCGDPRPRAPVAGSSTVDLLGQARDAAARGDHAAAVERLRDVIAARGDVVEAHYLLAVSASHLDQVDEAAQQFEWVAIHGAPESAEVTIARQWLAERVAASVAARPARVETPRAPVVEAQQPALAGVSGVATDTSGPKARLLLFLKGVPGSAVENEYRSLRTDRGGHFQFVNVPPGDYVLTDAVAGPPTWRLRLSLTRGQQLALDLTQANQAAGGSE
jgi:hypothetical protein